MSSIYLPGTASQIKKNEMKQKAPKNIYVPYPIFAIMGGVIKPTIKLHIQLAEVLIDMALARARSGKISDAYTHPIGPHE